MLAFTYFKGQITAGLKLLDSRFGQAVLLGTPKKGRKSNDWQEAIGLPYQNPAIVIDGRVMAANLKKISPQNKREFWQLAAGKFDPEACLVLVSTRGVYTKGTSGHTEVLAGNPEFKVSGHGSERAEMWHDHLVVFHPGDVLKVVRAGGSKQKPQVIYLENDEPVVQDYDAWHALQQSQQAEVKFGRMLAYTFTGGYHGGELEVGLDTVETQAGLSLALGEDQRRDYYVLLPVVGLDEFPMEAALAESDNNFSLVHSDQTEEGKFLVRINTQWSYSSGNGGWIEVVAGEPVQIEHGTCRKGMAHDDLWVLSEGDVLKVHIQGAKRSDDQAILVKNGGVEKMPLLDWETQNAQADPSRFIEEGIAPIEHVPDSWIGAKVVCCDKQQLENWSSVGILVELPAGKKVAVIDLDPNSESNMKVNFTAFWIKLMD